MHNKASRSIMHGKSNNVLFILARSHTFSTYSSSMSSSMSELLHNRMRPCIAQHTDNNTEVFTLHMHTPHWKQTI